MPEAMVRPGPAKPAPPTRQTKPAILPATEFPEAGILLERCFLELVRYYRHSGCGRLCRGLVHRMNTSVIIGCS